MEEEKRPTDQEGIQEHEGQRRLEEAEETLRAIRQYLVDAFVISRPDGSHVVTLGEADFPYRMMVESMNEGAATLIGDGSIFYCNPRLAEMLKVDAGELIGTHFQDFILDDQKPRFEALMAEAQDNASREQFELKTGEAECMPVQLSMYRLGSDPIGAVSIIATDITERVHAEQKIRALISELTMAEQDERQRISEILHDDLQQRLFAIKAQLSFLQEPAPDSDAGSAQKELDQIQAYLSDAINIARNLSIDLSPMILQGEGLAEALVWLNAQMKRRYGLDVDLQADHDLRSMDKSLRMLIFQAVREFLFNVVKHSDQLKATISLLKDGSSDLVIVKDEGKGFDPEIILSDQALAHGLLLIKNRLALIGCSMEVQSAPGEGTSILIRIPNQAA